MGIERNVSKPKGKVYGESKKNRRKQKKTTVVVQKLYETCKEVFSDCGPGVVPSPDKVERLKVVLDSMTEVDVGLRPDMTFFKATTGGEIPRITYLHLYACEKFSIGIFCLPPTGVIPLHNHPGMTVFSKLLFGTMHIKSYDWVGNGPDAMALNADPLEEHPSRVRLAKVKVDSEFTAPCNTSILYPADGGNMHCFKARTPCAVLDVLGPPYCDPEGRHCEYYMDFPFTKFSVVNSISVPVEERDGYAWLEERDRPKDVTVVGEVYSGPKIVEK
ncbi:plant cysteine oxidase 2-like [Coffea eugenioides]|uniref:plant cysteine oxidase 2-like n=1 Tax=Coffea eugenioides TaxID=49369 RepID=UPI000F604E8A|nr:plant cysteine oxidase 2-like [Coffea eugenioides]